MVVPGGAGAPVMETSPQKAQGISGDVWAKACVPAKSNAPRQARPDRINLIIEEWPLTSIAPLLRFIFPGKPPNQAIYSEYSPYQFSFVDYIFIHIRISQSSLHLFRPVQQHFPSSSFSNSRLIIVLTAI
jgi:hypothetical protein